MDALNTLVVIIGTIAAFNFLLVILCFALFWRSKRSLEHSRKILHVEGDIKQDIEEHANRLSEKLVMELVGEFRKSFADESARFSKLLMEAANEQIRSMGEYTKDAQKQISSEAQMVAARFVDSAHDEIEQYKRVQMLRVDEQIPKIIESVSKEVLNKAINLNEHQDLVMAALERAKADGIFSEGAVVQASVNKSKPPVSSGKIKSTKAKTNGVKKVVK